MLPAAPATIPPSRRCRCLRPRGLRAPSRRARSPRCCPMLALRTHIPPSRWRRSRRAHHRHGRLLAAQSLGLETVPTIIRTGLTEAQKAAYRLADNRIALNAGWDEALLAAKVAKLQEMGGVDLALTGFDGAEIERLLTGLETEVGNLPAPAIASGSEPAPTSPTRMAPRRMKIPQMRSQTRRAGPSPSRATSGCSARPPPALRRRHRRGDGRPRHGNGSRGAALHQSALREPARLHHRRRLELGRADARRLRRCLRCDARRRPGAGEPRADLPRGGMAALLAGLAALRALCVGPGALGLPCDWNGRLAPA